jgi:hypothetical protein
VGRGEDPLRYSREKKIVYSVGSDSLDSGGSSHPDPIEALEDNLEPTFRLGNW